MKVAPLDSAITHFLEARGYQRLPLECNAVGHFEIQGEINGSSVRLLVDTGASGTVLDRAAAERLGLRTSESEELAGGVGTSNQAVESARVDSFSLAGLSLEPRALFVLDLSHVNVALDRHGGSPIDGAVGGDILRPREAIIDYARSALYLRQEEISGG